ncbi:MAG: hypothetical protein M3081_16575 [Gemmatimonadota bacterium]|nr:hypothetical protein [Gemmatimonadota bacterium]
MRRIPLLATAATMLVATNVHAQGAGTPAPVHIPGPGEGYLITRTDPSTPAPSGYEGRTEISTLTAVGNTPATDGKRVTARFTLGNKVKTCPKADGTAEGEGELSFSIESTDAQANGTSRIRIEGRATGTYKGQVSDDGFLHDPVKAEIEYTYTLSGTIRDQSGAIATPAGSNVTQHVTIEFRVGGLMSAPTLGTFTGGDPTKGHYGEAYGTGMALTYWAGVWYSIAMTKWQQPNTCVNIAFDPPSNTVTLVRGGKTTVKAEVKTKSGETTKAHFAGARPRSAVGAVTPAEGPSDVGSPMRFTFTAPDQNVKTAGFVVNATSRAGAAEGEWNAGVGPDWSGQISFAFTFGDQGENEMQSWSSSNTTRITVNLKNGTGTANGYTEMRDMKVSRQKALRGGAITLIKNQSITSEGTVEDQAPATVEVVSPSEGTYVIRVSYVFKNEGTSHTQMCGRDNCREYDQRMLIGGTLPAMEGKMDDPNHLSGSKTISGTGGGYQGHGTTSSTITWNLARSGTGK